MEGNYGPAMKGTVKGGGERDFGKKGVCLWVADREYYG